jgi:hypothetical protein
MKLLVFSVLVLMALAQDCSPTLGDEKTAKDIAAILVNQSRISKPYPCPAAWAGQFDTCRSNVLWNAVAREISFVFGPMTPSATIRGNAQVAVNNMKASCAAVTPPPTAATAPPKPAPCNPTLRDEKTAKDVANDLIDKSKNGDPDYPCPAAYKTGFNSCQEELLRAAVDARYRFIAGPGFRSGNAVALAVRTIKEVCSITA